ncbi:MAG: hypothetical protein M1370_10225 [Bacteroidetes bacterium]|nr:hypothetical protein [Bacteroidota bacterium]MCL5026885.1 hypothetical protein [Chloroflexota bacterium]
MDSTAWAIARDIVIVVYGILWAIAALVTIVVMLMVLGLVRRIEKRSEPILDSARVTATTVQATTRFVGELVVRPAASIVGAGVAVGRLVQVLAGGQPRARRR